MNSVNMQLNGKLWQVNFVASREQPYFKHPLIEPYDLIRKDLQTCTGYPLPVQS
jgi:hypothetical protein